MSIKDQLDSARRVIDLEITKVTSNSSLIKNGGCASCHILFKLIETLSLNESDATDLLSEVLYQDPQLNERFIEMVEKIHMKDRLMGVRFSIKSREAKDRYIDANIKNTISELSTEGVDHHAATEELYYYMKKNEDISTLIVEFINKICKINNGNYS